MPFFPCRGRACPSRWSIKNVLPSLSGQEDDNSRGTTSIQGTPRRRTLLLGRCIGRTRLPLHSCFARDSEQRLRNVLREALLSPFHRPGALLSAGRSLLFPSQPCAYYTSRFVFCKVFLRAIRESPLHGPPSPQGPDERVQAQRTFDGDKLFANDPVYPIRLFFFRRFFSLSKEKKRQKNHYRPCFSFSFSNCRV